ncbi:lipid kinase [Pseudoroseomonas cervicalis]|uniref:Putative lipid kinase n=1 Tax=Pseudoroseomonas cervicalis ATCC 49957 TaxID=525371 RepID=D5RL00_9PROT|nr:lipid kinase [Pseudoroseomonas cervicalis]EFH12026.1 putative lipid kinase [Pseudoroseomonas cervicalis ATCC 49957]
MAGAEAPFALVIVNRQARNGGSAIDAALDVLRRAGWRLEEHRCTPEERAAAVIARRAAEGFSAVILGGGDGTLNAAAPALMETRLPFGILPLGTANDLARSLEIPPDPVAAARIIAAGQTRPIDLGEVNGLPYFNVASIGFSAELARRLGRDDKKRWGKLGYALAAFRLLRQLRPFTAWLEHDGTTERVRTIQVSVGNGRHYGGGMTVESTARPDDGKLDVYSLEIDHWWRLLALLPSLRRGTQGQWRDVRAFPTTACAVVTRRRMPVNTDGEINTHTPARFRLLPAAVRVFVPPVGEASASGNP